FLREYKGRWLLNDGAVALYPMADAFTVSAWSTREGSTDEDGGLDLWPLYLEGSPSGRGHATYHSPLFPHGQSTNHYVGAGRRSAGALLASAYQAARAARFDREAL